MDGEGNINVINAAIEAGVKKFVLVTSIGTGDSKDAPAQQVYDTLKPVLVEKEKAEEALKVRLCIAITFSYVTTGRPQHDVHPTSGIIHVRTFSCPSQLLVRRNTPVLHRLGRSLYVSKPTNEVSTESAEMAHGSYMTCQ